MKPIRIGIVGGGFMAKAHTLALNNLQSLYWPDLPPVVKVRLADLSDDLARQAADRWGWSEATTDWTRITRADDVDLVDIVTPNDAHADVAIDAAEHGKHILCEKPLAARLEAAREMYEAVASAGVINQVDFVYRAWPAIRLAKEILDEGSIGQVMHFRAYFLQDYALDASLPMMWRLQRERAGAGSLGDTGSHLIDIARFLVGDVSRVSGRLRTFVEQRRNDPQDGEAAFRTTGFDESVGSMATVEVDDAADLLLEFENGAIGVVQTNWVAAGHKIDLGFEIGGDGGAIRFSWTAPNELEFFSTSDPEGRSGFRKIIVGPTHSGAAEFWPVAGQGLGYGDAFLMGLRDLLSAVAHGRAASPNFLDGLRVQEVVDAAVRSAESEAWVEVAGSAAISTRTGARGTSTR